MCLNTQKRWGECRVPGLASEGAGLVPTGGGSSWHRREAQVGGEASPAGTGGQPVSRRGPGLLHTLGLRFPSRGVGSIRARLLRVLAVSRLPLGRRAVSEIPLYGNSPSCWSFYTVSVDLLSTEPVPFEPQSTPSDPGTVARGTHAVCYGDNTPPPNTDFLQQNVLIHLFAKIAKGLIQCVYCTRLAF